MAWMMIKVFYIMMACMVVLMPHTLAMISTCGQVFDLLKPCINYLNRGGLVPRSCCDGVKELTARTRPDNQRSQISM
ncbi:hypothetical protein R6Q59_036292 [Mikania micrantha]